MSKQASHKAPSGEFSEQDLLRYIAGSLPEDVQYQLELKMESDPGLKAAVEGLQDFRDPEDICTLSQQLKRHLRQQVKSRKSKDKKFVRSGWYIWLALVIFLLLAFIAFTYYQLLV